LEVDLKLISTTREAMVGPPNWQSAAELEIAKAEVELKAVNWWQQRSPYAGPH